MVSYGQKSNRTVKKKDLKKRNLTDEDSEEDAPPKKKARAQKVCSPLIQSSKPMLLLLQKPISDDEEMIEDGYPSKCPVIGCNDAFPAHPSVQLKKAYKTYRIKYNLVYNEGVDPHEVQLATARFSVCYAIEGMSEIPGLQQEAVENDWPLEIDFGEALRHRVIGLKGEITALFDNEIVLANCAAWKSFVGCLVASKMSLSKFGHLRDIDKFGMVRGHIHAG